MNRIYAHCVKGNVAIVSVINGSVSLFAKHDNALQDGRHDDPDVLRGARELCGKNLSRGMQTALAGAVEQALKEAAS